MDDFDLPDDLKDDVEVIYYDENDLDFSDEEDNNIGMINDIEGNEIDRAGDQTKSIEPEVNDLSKLTFTKHTQSVFTCDLNKDGSLAVTGGEDDAVYVWFTSNGEMYMECTGHRDSVTEVGFSYDDQLVATGDMSGLIQVWNVKSKKLIWCYEGDDLEWLKWHDLANVMVAGMQSGNTYIWQIPQGNCKVLGAHGVPTTCGKILPDGKRVLVGYQDGSIKLWDMKFTTAIWQYTGVSQVNNLDINVDSSLLAIVPESVVIKISDGKAVGRCSVVNTDKDVEAVLFNDEMGTLITGSLTGQLCMWDVSKQTLRHQAEIGSAVTSLKWGAGGRLLVGTVSGAIYVCDIKRGELIKTLTGHKQDILSMCVSKDRSILLTTSDDHTAKIFNIRVD